MRLVVAEKPSVAMAISKVLGADTRRDGYYEGNGWLVSWCIGHLIELADPDAYGDTYSIWKYEDLPILPKEWKYCISESTKKQFSVLKELMNRPVEICCATDAGREGELIFRHVYKMSGCRKPFERLWISSMEDEAIREGFEHLVPSEMYDSLYRAGSILTGS